MRRILIILMLVLILMPVVTAQIIIVKPSSSGGDSSSNVNSSEYWNTNLGPLDNANSTQFENTGGTLSIIQSWILGLINQAKIWQNSTGTTKMITPQNLDMQEKNIEDVTNITLINSIKDSNSNSRVYFNVNGTFVVRG